MVNQNRSVVSTIKSKLIAAVAMLLVGVFMVISSSYAWFTLSTAPEVTGIYTSVGANGNLEMALIPAEGGISAITSTVRDSGKNTAWGNLVDLGGEYGLDKVQLLPARLDVTKNDDGTFKLNDVGLLAPTYGADGRVSGLKGVSTGIYDGTNAWKVGTTEGVSALGLASGMSVQQSAWMQYKRNVNSSLAAAQNLAHGTFTEYGTNLANVVMTRAMNGTGATFDISFAEEMITSLEAANAKIAEAAKYYFAAKAAEGLYNVSDAVWSAAVREIEAVDFTTVTGSSITIQSTPVGFDATLTKVLAKYNEIKGKLEAAKTNLINLGAIDLASVTWTQASSVLIETGFLTYEKQILVSGKTTEEIKEMMNGDILAEGAEIPPELMDFGMEFVENGTVDFTSGSGVHADIAEITGVYQAEISVSVTVKNIPFRNDKVKLRTVIDSDGERVDMYAALSQGPADNENSGTEKLITDFYGYKLDFAFRTNAQGSSLMLQTKEAGRIYATEGSDETMGHGSTMTFAISDTSFSVDQAKMLMSAVRIVFLDANGNIIGLGLLAQPGDNDTATFDANDHVVSTNNEITSDIYLYNFDFDAEENNKYGKISVGKKITATDDGKTELMKLNQNDASKLSVLVYLDGDVVDNSMVAATEVASLVGTLNLQFASSADLVPMDYTDLKENGEEASSATTTEAATEAATEAETN